MESRTNYVAATNVYPDELVSLLRVARLLDTV